MRTARRHRQGAAAVCAALVSVLALDAPAGAAPAYVSQWGTTGTAERQFDDPGGVAVDAAGNVYVADTQNDRVQKFLPDGTFVLAWGFGVDTGANQAQVCTSGCQAGIGSAGAGGFNTPVGVTVDAANVYVVDQGNNRIQKFDLNGGFTDEFGSNGGDEGELNNPRGIAVDNANNVYVADRDNRRIDQFDSLTGAFERMWGFDVTVAGTSTGFEVCEDLVVGMVECQTGTAPTGTPGNGQFSVPEDVAVDGAGDVYVVDGSAGGPVQKFLPTATGSQVDFLTRWGGVAGAGDGQFNQPRGIDVALTTGDPLIVDQSNRRVQRFSSAGAFGLTFGWDVIPGGGTGFEVCTGGCKAGQFGSGNGQFTSPLDVAVGPDGIIYVSDTASDRIQRFDDSGSTGSTNPFPPPPPLPSGLPAPVLGKQVNVSVVTGKVLIAVPAKSAARGAARSAQKGLKFVPLTGARQIPVRSFLNTRKGTVRLRSAVNTAGKTQSGDFSSGLFQVLQSRKKKAKGLTDLVLKGGKFTGCGRPKQARAALSKRAIRRLRGNARGRYRTRGRYSAATVRGTKWTVTDRCDNTLTKVTRGKVAVRDFRRKKTIIVKAGKSYLARARR